MNPTMTLEEKKARLKSEIKLLERLKNDTKNNIENFDDNNQNEMNNYSFVTTNSDDESSSTLKIKDELLKLAGLRCIKIVKDDYVFEFTVKGDDDNKRINYFIQLLKVDNVIKLGKWNFPLLLDVNDIWNEINVVDVNTLSQFLRKCKHCIECYHHRMNQFQKFQNSMQKCGNCIVNRDGGYRCFMIELLQVSNVKTNDYMNIIVYLQYNLEEIRPFKIKVETQFDGPLPPETEKDIRPFFKPFKQLDLTDALETIEYKENHLFSWQRAERDYTLINDVDLDETSPTRKPSSSKRTGKMKKPSGSSNSKKNKSRESQTDIAEYFKKPKSVTATKKKSASSSQEQSEQESSSNISTPAKKKQQKLKRLQTNKNKYAKKSKTTPKQNENQSQTEQSDQNTTNETQSINKEKRILQSSNSLTNETTTPKKNPPKKVIKSLKIQTQIQAKATNSSPRRNSPRKLGQLSTNSSPRRSSLRKQGQLSNSTSPKKISSTSTTTSSSSSPQKVGIFKKLSPKNDARQKKKLAPKKSGPLKKSSKAIQSKKLETLKKLVAPQVEITSPKSNVKLKQTNLQLTKIDNPNSRKSIINLNNSEYVLRTKIVTSTPHVEKTKRLRQSLVDMNLSEIKNAKKNVSKSPTKRTVKKTTKVMKK